MIGKSWKNGRNKLDEMEEIVKENKGKTRKVYIGKEEGNNKGRRNAKMKQEQEEG